MNTIVLLALLTACDPGNSVPGDLGDHASGTAADTATQGPPSGLPQCMDIGLEPLGRVSIDTLAAGLRVPWDLVTLSDGRILVSERTGSVRTIGPYGLDGEPWATFDVPQVAEAGLLGIDAAPDFEVNRHIYLTMTYEDVPDGAIRGFVAAVRRRVTRLFNPEGGQVWLNRVVRLTDQGGQGVDPVVVLDRIPSGSVHAGGALRFGPDGGLYLGIGDGGVPHRAGRGDSWGGKILRLDSLAPSSPGVAVSILASGLRNPQGMAWMPPSGAALEPPLLAIDHGPTGLARENFRRHQDELNHIVPGGDHGWPAASGMEQRDGSRLPLVEWTPAIAPAGLAVVDMPGSPWHGDAVVTGLRGAQLRRIVLDRTTTAPEGPVATCEEALLALDYGRLRAIRAGPDGFLYVGTSNRDQRGTPGANDDMLLRIAIPAGAERTP